MRTRAKVDGNQVEIVRALREIGAEVTSLAGVGHGVADLLVSFGGVWYVIEAKDRRGSLTVDQHAWIARQRAPVAVVKTVPGALAAVGVVMVEGR